MSEQSPVPRRVQIAPLGFEDARIREPIDEWRADAVVAIAYDDGEGGTGGRGGAEHRPDDPAATVDVPYLESLLADLEADDRIDLDVRSCDIFDLYEALGTIAGAIDDYRDDDVYVNVSAGSKITAVAGTIACMATGATPIYARPDYGPDAERIPDEPLHEAVAETFALPAYPIDRPDDLLLSFMRFVDERSGEGDEARAGTGRYRGPSKRDLIEFGREAGFDAFERSTATTEKGYYRVLDAHVLDPLLERGYVEVERVGRSKYVTLTPDGENALRAFGHLVREE